MSHSTNGSYHGYAQSRRDAAIVLVRMVNRALEKYGSVLPETEANSALNSLLVEMRHLWNEAKQWRDEAKQWHDEADKIWEETREFRENRAELDEKFKQFLNQELRDLGESLLYFESSNSYGNRLLKAFDLGDWPAVMSALRDVNNGIAEVTKECEYLRAKVAVGNASVNLRTDGRGDPWANLHRTHTSRECYMGDIDCIEVSTGAGPVLIRGEDNFFFEHACRKRNGVLDIEVIALFDRKARRSASWNESMQFKSDVYKGICYNLSKGQFIKPRYFFVYGTDNEFEIEEADPVTGKRSGRVFTLDRLYSWEPVWEELGLMRDRKRAMDYLRHRRTA